MPDWSQRSRLQAGQLAQNQQAAKDDQPHTSPDDGWNSPTNVRWVSCIQKPDMPYERLVKGRNGWPVSEAPRNAPANHPTISINPQRNWPARKNAAIGSIQRYHTPCTNVQKGDQRRQPQHRPPFGRRRTVSVPGKKNGQQSGNGQDMNGRPTEKRIP